MAALLMASMSPTGHRTPLTLSSMSSGDAADAGGDGGHATSHGLKGGESEGLHFGGHEHEVGEG